MRVCIPFDALLVGTLFSLLLVSKLSLVHGGCNDSCDAHLTSTDCTANINIPNSKCTQCWNGECNYPFCGDPCPPGPGGDAICAGNDKGCTECRGNDDDGYFCTNPTCGFVKCDYETDCVGQTESGCTRCDGVCTQPYCGDYCYDYLNGKPSDAICAGNDKGCTKCLQNDDDGGWYCTSEPPLGLPSSSPSSLPSSSPSSIPSQKPSAPTKKKTKKTKTGKKKAKMPTVQKKKTRKSKK